MVLMGHIGLMVFIGQLMFNFPFPKTLVNNSGYSFLKNLFHYNYTFDLQVMVKDR